MGTMLMKAQMFLFLLGEDLCHWVNVCFACLGFFVDLLISFFIWGPHTHFWLSAQESLLVGLRETYAVPGIQPPGSVICMANALLTVQLLQSVKFSKVLILL